MRFASLGGSNAANYAAAGKSVADSAANMFAVQRKTGPDYAGLSKVAMKATADVTRAGFKASEKMTNSAVNAVTGVAIQNHRIAEFKNENEIKQKQKMAGSIAAVGKIAGAGFLAASDPTKGRERPKADFSSVNSDFRTKRDSLLESHRNESDAHGAFSFPDFKPATGDTPGKVTTGDSPTNTGASSNLGGQPFDLSKLTDSDYNELGYVISSEAALNTNDEFGVAANVLTRLQSGKYGNSIGEIIRADGQYEGVYTNKSRYSPEIVARLKSPEGQKKIQEYFQQLDGRTEFKGQSQKHNRVRSEDPMFDPAGNFYHYAWQ